MSQEKQYRPQPRGDFVIIRTERVEMVRGLLMPEITVQGKRFVVEAVGPKVEDLAPGDVVMMTGQQGADWSAVPNYPDLLIICEGNVVLKFVPECAPAESAYDRVADDKDFHA